LKIYKEVIKKSVTEEFKNVEDQMQILITKINEKQIVFGEDNIFGENNINLFDDYEDDDDQF